MSAAVLVAYATKHGSTAEVAEAIAADLRARGLRADVRDARQVSSLAGYAAVVLGGALYMGRWHRAARRFLARHRAALAELPLAVFAMGPATLEAKAVAGSRAQLDAALAREPGLRPRSVAIFGGVVDPAQLHFPLNHMRPVDARDWDAVHAWSGEVAGELEAA